MGLFGLGDDSTDDTGGDSSAFLMPMAAQAMQADPRMAMIRSIMETGQNELNQPTYTPMAALAKALISGIGGVSSAYLENQYANAAKGAPQEIGAALSSSDPLTALTNSKNPVARMMGFQLAPQILSKRLEPRDVAPNHIITSGSGGPPLASNPVPLTDLGKLIAARDALAPNDPNRAAFDAQIQKLNSENGVQFTGNGAAPIPGYGTAKGAIAGQTDAGENPALIARAGGVAAAEEPTKIIEDAASYGLRPVPLSPTEGLQSGFYALPPAVQAAISSSVRSLPAVQASQQPQAPNRAPPPAPSAAIINGAPAPGTPTTPTSPASTAAPSSPTAPLANGGGVAPMMTPLQYKSQEERADALEKYGEGLDTNSSNAVQGNFLIDQMRSEGQGFNQGKFSDISGDARSVLDGFRSTFFPDAPPSQPLADWQSFNKNAMQITMQAVHATSSRAAAQEFQMIQTALPSSQMSQGGFNQIANQLESVNDFHIAKQAAAQQWRQTHGQTLDGFETDWNSHVTPGAFLVNRLDPADLQSLYDRLNQTNQGKLIAKSLAAHAQWAAQNGLFGQQ